MLNLNLEAMRPGERVSSDEYEKESIADFALWKARVPEDGEVFWDSPWGEGRPGWHIECSAMSMELLGPSFDLHLGGEDLVFPHHEDEIAQSEGACLQCDGHKFVKYWMHGAHLLVEGKKMSKSLGNFFTLRDLLAKGSAGREVRYLMISAHYRETFNFTLDNLAGAKTALGRIDECTAKLRELALGQAAEPAADSPLVTRFTEAMDDDLNVSAAWGAVFDWVRDTNRKLAANEPHRRDRGNRVGQLGTHQQPCSASSRSRRKRRRKSSPSPRNAKPPARPKTSPAPTKSATNSPPKAGSSRTPPKAPASSEPNHRIVIQGV